MVAAAQTARQQFHMNVSCPHCATVFRVDPAKVPAEGVRARCAICRGVFRVEAPAQEPAAVIELPVAQPVSQPAEQRAVPPAAAQEPERPAAPRPAGFAFGATDPAAKARRLARALVSDMVTYHPERREQALSNGTLKREFKEEIRKSWEEYVEQVGTETALGTPFFRDALNEILARGQPLF